jgi:excisionase family DNA binding protein
MDGFYSIAEFLRIYSMGRTSLYRAVNAGQIRITKIGRSSRIAKADAKAWADNLPTTGGEASA